MIFGTGDIKIGSITIPTNQMEFLSLEQKNIATYEKVSIDGTLHRDYQLDSSGNVKKQIVYNVNYHSLTTAQYNAIIALDKTEQTFYPRDDNARNYQAYIDMYPFHLNNLYSKDAVNITISIISQN